MAEELDGTAGLFEDGGDPFATLAGSEDTAPVEESAAATTEDEGSSAAENSLIDPATLPDELKPHWSRMTRAYNRRLADLRTQQQSLADLRIKADAYDRLQAQDYPQRTAQGQPQPQPAADVPLEFQREIYQAIANDPDMQGFASLAPFMAKAAWDASQQIVKQEIVPLKEAQATEKRQQQTARYEQMVNELTERAPDWLNYEDEIAERLTFLRNALAGNGPMSDPRYGSVLQLMYQWVTGPAKATAEAGQRMQRAVQNRSSTSTAQRTPAPSLESQIKEAPLFQDKLRLAFRDALAQAREAGG